MRKPVIAGNWKMNMTCTQALEYMRVFIPLLKDIPNKDREVVIAPPFTALFAFYIFLETPTISIFLGSLIIFISSIYIINREKPVGLSHMVKCDEILKLYSEESKDFIETFQVEWSNSKHKNQWINTLRTYANPRGGC